MKRGLKNTILGLLGFSAAPMLTACYGVAYEPDYYWNRDFEGQVVDTIGNPIEGIQVRVSHQNGEYAPVVTDAEGKFNVHVHTTNGYSQFVAEDVDGEANGHFDTAYESLSDFDGVIEMVPYGTNSTNNDTENGNKPSNREPR